jgi:hypothetical protein
MAVGDNVTAIADGDRTREILRERIRIYRNDWEDLLDKELSKQFVTETWERIKLMLDTSQNIFRRIIRDTCTVYKKKVVRELVVPSSEGAQEPQEVPAYDLLLEQTSFDWKLAEASRLAKAAWVCFLRPRVLADNGEMRMDIITPDCAHVDLNKDDPLRMDGFGYRVIGLDKRKQHIECWVYYTSDQIRYLDSTGREIENPFTDDLDTMNPYGVIPVVPYFCTAPTDEFWDLNWNRDAVRANYIIGVLNTYMNYLVKTQSFKQVTFTGAISQDVLSAISDPLYPFVLPEGSTAATLDLNTQLEAIDSVIKGKVMAIANNYGISSENFNVSGSLASGYSLKIANRALEEIREADKLVAAKTEKELFGLMRLIANQDGLGPISEDLELKWNPGEISYPPSMAEEQSRWEFEFRNGLSNQIDYLLDDDPEMSREDAMVILQRVKDESQELKPEKSVLDTMFGQEKSAPFMFGKKPKKNEGEQDASQEG